MIKKLCLIISLSVILVQFINAQPHPASQSLLLQQSPLLQGAGSIGAAIPMEDASGFYYNPAQLGYFSRENNFSVSVLPQKTRWIPRFNFDLNFSSYSIAAGYNFKNSKRGLPLSIGVGYTHNKMDFNEMLHIGPNLGFGGTYISPYDYEIFDCFSVGASYEYYLIFNLGISVKSINSLMSNNPALERGILKSNSTAFDFGAMITAPLSKLYFDDFNVKIDNNTLIKPKVDFTLGYSLTNVGKELYYSSPAIKYALPKTARLGYSFNFGIELYKDAFKFNLLDYSFTAEAENYLVEENLESGISYKNIMGDIKIGKNLIQLEDDKTVSVHRGHILRIFDTLVLISGRVYGRDDEFSGKTNGYGITSQGIFKILNDVIDEPIVDYITEHFNLEYYNTNIYVDTLNETNLIGLVINYKGVKF
ncbi:MAG: hypothetical protein V1773_10595 [bacterium]